MTYTILSVFNILVAGAMIALIMMQRGAGADAGASFGGGSSGTVFGARGSATFLSRATAVLAGVFFIISLAMGVLLQHEVRQVPAEDLGIMSGLMQDGGETPSAGMDSLAVPAAETPVAPAAQAPATPADAAVPSADDAAASAPEGVPAAPANDAEAVPDAPAENGSAG